ncbi:ribonuclease M5 [Bacillus safensis FO-36b] [Bacillus safensis subsp. safensis]
MPKHLAKAKRDKGIGVEHASLDSIRECLAHVHEEMEESESDITLDDLFDAGLIGGEASKRRRERLGVLLNIGYTNAKQLQKRLHMFQITKHDFIAALKTVMQEEADE